MTPSILRAPAHAWTLACLVAAMPVSAAAQCVDYADHLRWIGGVDTGFDGEARDIAVAGSRAYLANLNSGFYVLDVGDPRAPRILGHVDTPHSASAVDVAGPYAYVADGATGLLVIDVSDPGDPRIVGTVDTPGYAWDVVVSGTLAYLSDQYRLLVIDVANPAAPWIRGGVDLAQFGVQIALSGHHVFAAVRTAGFQVIDVGDPSAPAVVAGGPPTPVEGIAVHGAHAYLACQGNGLVVLDISDPVHPQVVGVADEPGATAGRVAVDGPLAWVADGSRSVRTVDVSDPADPRLLGRMSLSPFSVQGIAAIGPLAYVANGYAGVQILDGTAPAAVPTLGSLDEYLGFRGVAATATHAFVGLDDLFQSVDITDIHTPVADGGVALGRDILRIALDGNLAYVANSGLAIVDVSDPRFPQIVSNVDVGAHCIDLVLAGTRVLAASGEDGLVVFDVSDPAAPAIEGWIPTGDYAAGIALYGNLAFVADRDGGLLVVEVSRPTAPRIIETVPLQDAVDVDVIGDAVVVATQLTGIHVFRATDPSDHRIVTNLRTPYSTRSVTGAGPFAYVADSGVGVVLVDVSDPRAPRVTGSVDVPYSRDIFVAAEHVFVTTTYDPGGLRIVPRHCGPAFASTGVPVPASAAPTALRTFPNPSVKFASVRVETSARGAVRATIHDAAGRLVRRLADGTMDAGAHDLAWDHRDATGRPVASGVYLLRVATVDGTRTTRMVVLK